MALVVYWRKRTVITNFDALNLSNTLENVEMAFGRNPICDVAISLRRFRYIRSLFTLKVVFKGEPCSNSNDGRQIRKDCVKFYSKEHVILYNIIAITYR